MKAQGGLFLRSQDGVFMHICTCYFIIIILLKKILSSQPTYCKAVTHYVVCETLESTYTCISCHVPTAVRQLIVYEAYRHLKTKMYM